MNWFEIYVANEAAKQDLERLNSDKNNLHLRSIAEIKQSRSDFATRITKAWEQLKPRRSSN